MKLNILNKTGQNLYRFCPVSILPDIYLCLQSLSLCLYFCISHSCSSWFFRTNIQNKKSKVNSFYVYLYFFCFTNIIAGLSSSSTFTRHGWCVNRFKRNKLSDKILLLKEYHNIDFSFFPSFELFELNNRLLPLSDFYLSASEMHRVVWIG